METNCSSEKNNKEVLDITCKENINQSNYLKKEKGNNELKPGKEKPSSKKSNEKTNETKRLEMWNKVSLEDLQELCNQLSSFNKRVQNARELVQLRYDLPNEMRDKLETEAGELESLYKELQSASSDMQTIQIQREALGKEKLCMQAQLSQLKTDAINELEVIVSVYDTPMLERWAEVKAGDSVAAAENFLHDVKGKLQAMKNLQILGSQKLLELQKGSDKREANTTKRERRKKNRGERLSWDLSPSNSSFPSLGLLQESDSEDLVDDPYVHNVLYSLVYDQVLNLPAWTQGPLDID